MQLWAPGSGLRAPGSGRVESGAMNPNDWSYFMPLLAVAPLMLLNIAWYVAVIVFLYKIWKKVKHLPG